MFLIDTALDEDELNQLKESIQNNFNFAPRLPNRNNNLWPYV